MNDSISIYNTNKANSGTIWILFLLFGWSYGSLDEMGLQIVFYLTLGGFGLWFLIRIFTLNGAIKEYNKKMAIQAGVTPEELIRLGLI
jgi:hypothetical protein